MALEGIDIVAVDDGGLAGRQPGVVGTIVLDLIR